MSTELIELIRKSPLGTDLTEQEQGVLADIAELRNLSDKEVLISEGTADNTLHVVVSGNLGVTKGTGGGDRTTLHVLHAGDFAGALGFIDGGEHTATLQSMGETQVISLERGSFEALLDREPRIVYQVMRAIVRSVHAIVRRMNIQYVEMTNYITKAHGRY